jgi:hypothetical protein
VFNGPIYRIVDNSDITMVSNRAGKITQRCSQLGLFGEVEREAAVSF